MRILITNTALENRAGTEMYVRDLAHGLKQRGHTVFVYTERLGEFAEELRISGIDVLADPKRIEQPPDIIHGHHHLTTMTALLAFPQTPAIFVCHGPEVWQEEPPLFPRIANYVAVDHACRERIQTKGIAPDQIHVLPNFVDINRFRPRPPLPHTPRRALIFSNQASDATQTPAIFSACRRAGISVDVVGSAAGNVCAEPETILRSYDVVFAKAKAALEALAVGAAVVVCDAAGVGSMVTTTNVGALRDLNFGVRCLNQPLDARIITEQLARYDANDAAAVCREIRATAHVDTAIDALVALYERTIASHQRSPASGFSEEQAAVAEYLRGLDKTICAFERDALKYYSLGHSRSWALFSKYVTVKKTFLSPKAKST